MTPPLVLSVATNLEDLLLVEPEWKELWLAAAGATPFQAPGWLIPYVHVFRPNALRVALVRRGRRLIALFPFFIDDSSGRPVLKILGVGVSDYLDALCCPKEELAVSGLLEAWLGQELERCQYAEFGQLREDATLRRIPRPGVFREDLVPGVPCPILSLGSKTPALCLAPSIRRNLRYSFRQAEKLGRVRLEIANQESIEAALRDLFSLHRKRWRSRGLPGIFETQEQQAFYREAFCALHRTSTTKIFTLLLEEDPIAALAGFSHNQVLYHYIGAFDPDYVKIGPGNMIIFEAIDFAFKAGCVSFDFLRGQEPYKYKWGARDQKTFVRRILPSLTEGELS